VTKMSFENLIVLLRWYAVLLQCIWIAVYSEMRIGRIKSCEKNYFSTVYVALHLNKSSELVSSHKFDACSSLNGPIIILEGTEWLQSVSS
jgi:hypothetical protein